MASGGTHLPRHEPHTDDPRRGCHGGSGTALGPASTARTARSVGRASLPSVAIVVDLVRRRARRPPQARRARRRREAGRPRARGPIRGPRFQNCFQRRALRTGCKPPDVRNPLFPEAAGVRRPVAPSRGSGLPARFRRPGLAAGFGLPFPERFQSRPTARSWPRPRCGHGRTRTRTPGASSLGLRARAASTRTRRRALARSQRANVCRRSCIVGARWPASNFARSTASSIPRRCTLRKWSGRPAAPQNTKSSGIVFRRSSWCRLSSAASSGINATSRLPASS